MKKTDEGTILIEEEMQQYEKEFLSDEERINIEKRKKINSKKLNKLINDYKNEKAFNGLSFNLGNNLTIKTGKDSFLGVIDGTLVLKGLDIKGEESNIDNTIHILNVLKKGAYIENNRIEIYKPNFFTRFKRAFNYIFNYKNINHSTFIKYKGE